MAMDFGSFPIKNGGSFHSYVKVYQRVFSMAMTQEPIDWRYLPYIRPIFQAYVREYPHKIWSYVGQYLLFRILKIPLIFLMAHSVR